MEWLEAVAIAIGETVPSTKPLPSSSDVLCRIIKRIPVMETPDSIDDSFVDFGSRWLRTARCFAGKACRPSRACHSSRPCDNCTGRVQGKDSKSVGLVQRMEERKEFQNISLFTRRETRSRYSTPVQSKHSLTRKSNVKTAGGITTSMNGQTTGLLHECVALSAFDIPEKVSGQRNLL